MHQIAAGIGAEASGLSITLGKKGAALMNEYRKLSGHDRVNNQSAPSSRMKFNKHNSVGNLLKEADY